jgi:hypothetical protein
MTGTAARRPSMKCPVGRNPCNPCPLHVYTGEVNACQACIDDWTERAAIVEYQGNVTRPEAEALATRWLGEKIKKGDCHGR